MVFSLYYTCAVGVFERRKGGFNYFKLFGQKFELSFERLRCKQICEQERGRQKCESWTAQGETRGVTDEFLDTLQHGICHSLKDTSHFVPQRQKIKSRTHQMFTPLFQMWQLLGDCNYPPFKISTINKTLPSNDKIQVLNP